MFIKLDYQSKEQRFSLLHLGYFCLFISYHYICFGFGLAFLSWFWFFLHLVPLFGGLAVWRTLSVWLEWCGLQHWPSKPIGRFQFRSHLMFLKVHRATLPKSGTFALPSGFIFSLHQTTFYTSGSVSKESMGSWVLLSTHYFWVVGSGTHHIWEFMR